MHNPVGPWVEANSLYIDQSGFRERLLEVDREELVVFDVGLGAAANALAALHCAFEPGPPRRPMRLISFERELELLRYALKHADQFAHFTGYTEAIETLLAKGQWSKGSVIWELRHGDFYSLLESETQRPHFIFYDPYSQKVNRDMWTEVGFRKLREKSRDEGTMLMTYSQSTPVRVALLLAGFVVGQGAATGRKEETTQASTRVEDLKFPLGQKWFERWKKSGAKHPYECSPARQQEVEKFVQEHFQFRNYS